MGYPVIVTAIDGSTFTVVTSNLIGPGIRRNQWDGKWEFTTPLEDIDRDTVTTIRYKYPDSEDWSTTGSVDNIHVRTYKPARIHEEFITRLYNVCFDREPVASELKYWTDKIRCNGMSGAEIARQFIFSKEMNDKKLSDEEFVEVLYKAMLGRPSDPIGKAHWVEYLKGTTIRKSNDTQLYLVKLTREELFGGGIIDAMAIGADGRETGMSETHSIRGVKNAQEFYNICINYNLPMIETNKLLVPVQ